MADSNKALQLLADSYLRDALESGVQWLDSGKVYLGTIPGVDLADAECVAQLDACRRAGLLRFARADLVAAMDHTLVMASEWDLDGAQFHFLVVM